MSVAVLTRRVIRRWKNMGDAVDRSIVMGDAVDRLIIMDDAVDRLIVIHDWLRPYVLPGGVFFMYDGATRTLFFSQASFPELNSKCLFVDGVVRRECEAF